MACAAHASPPVLLPAARLCCVCSSPEAAGARTGATAVRETATVPGVAGSQTAASGTEATCVLWGGGIAPAAVVACCVLGCAGHAADINSENVISDWPQPDAR